jgi:hypothetical protein
MKINLHNINETCMAEIIAEGIVINNTQDALDIMANCDYQGARKIIFYEENITPDFFDLKTKTAGDILQKFTNYQVQVVIVGDYSKYSSKSLRDFIYESNKHGRISFVNSIEEAKTILQK